MDTLLLDRDEWDLCLDVNGNIAMASDPYAPAQDVASAIRLFSGELWYDTTKGVPYFSTILGKAVPPAVMRTQMIRAALTVPGVTGAQVELAPLVNRELAGVVYVSYLGSGAGSQIAFIGGEGGLSFTTIGVPAQ
jgi:hypothetical protein